MFFKHLLRFLFKKRAFLAIFYITIYVHNRIRYGPSAPKHAEKIWVTPQECLNALSPNIVKEHCGGLLDSPSKASGIVINKWPSGKVLKIDEYPKEEFCIDDWVDGIRIETIRKFKFKFCIEHWVNGIPWEKTGAYELMEKAIETSWNRRWDGCENIDDVIKRYENLDRIFEQIKQEGRLRRKEEVDSSLSWRESESIIHIGPGGQPYFGGSGLHRFAIAYILNLPLPAKIGLVHVSAIPYLNHYRKKNYYA